MHELDNKRYLFGRLLCPYTRCIILGLTEKKLPFSFEVKMSHCDDDSLPILLDITQYPVSGLYSIIEYLEIVYKGNQVMPTDLVMQNEVRRLVDWCNNILFHKITYHFVFERVYKRLWRLGSPRYDLLAGLRKTIDSYLSVANTLLMERNWLAGEYISWADLMLAANISCLDYLNEVNWKKFTELYVWYLKIKARPSFTTVLHENVPGIAPSLQYTMLDFDQDITVKRI